MKVFKPTKLSLMYRAFDDGTRYYLAATVMVFFPFAEPDRLLQDANLWKVVGDALGGDAALDEWMYKERGEVLVAGHAFPPGEGATACAVRLRCGVAGEGIDKKLFVVGDRRWHRGVQTDPEPFTSMPVDDAHAFGGEGFDLNPLGKGAVTLDDDGVPVHPLPNIEDPDDLITSPKKRPRPVGFRPIPITSPLRLARAGTYDEAWQRDRYPGFPTDFEWTFFNVAPEDQWLPGHFTGDETFTVENMHPDKREVAGRLPDVIGRCFITRKNREGEHRPWTERFEEVRLVPETLWLFPNVERGILIFRGVTEIASDDAGDVEFIMAAADRRGAPRPASHFVATQQSRMDDELAAIEKLRDADLLPPLPEGPPAYADEVWGDLGEVTLSKNLLKERLETRRTIETEATRRELAEKGLDPADYIPDQLDEEEEARRTEAMAKLRTSEDIEAHLAETQADAEAKMRSRAEKAGFDYDDMMNQAKRDTAGPPSFRAEAELTRVRSIVELGRNAGVPLVQLEEALADPRFVEALFANERNQVVTYRRSAHLQHPVEAMGSAESEAARARLVAAVEAGESLDRADYTGADLSGLDLRGASLVGLFAESADLSRADLTGADLTDAVLTRADLTGAQLGQAKLTRANLGQAILCGAHVEDADLSEATILGADLTEARLARVTLGGKGTQRTVFQDVLLEGADLSGARGYQVLFLRSTIVGPKLTGAHFEYCTFIECELSGVDFSEATLDKCSFVKVAADGCRLVGTKAIRTSFATECSWVGADFSRSELTGSNLRATDLRGASFAGATLDGCELSESNLQEANFHRARARGALFLRADLRRANLVAADLMEAIFSKANIRAADFTGANLFRCDFSHIEGDEATKLDEANKDFIRFVERRGGA